MNIAWNEFGQRFEYHEYKDTYKGGMTHSIDCPIEKLPWFRRMK